MTDGFMQCSANYIPLSPISFLERAAVVNGDKPSVVYGGVRYSWKETHQRCLNFASALFRLGVSRHDVPYPSVLERVQWFGPMTNSRIETDEGIKSSQSFRTIFWDRRD
ncbi:hypothetical protein ACLB2K_000890 [Fragaria x ananassa]